MHLCVNRICSAVCRYLFGVSGFISWTDQQKKALRVSRWRRLGSRALVNGKICMATNFSIEVLVENYFRMMDLMAVLPRKRSSTLNQQLWSILLAFKFQQCVAWLQLSRANEERQRFLWAMKHSVALWGSNAALGVSVNLLGTVNVFEAVKALCADGVSQL